MKIKEVFARKFVELKGLKYKSICSAYDELGLEIMGQYKMYKEANTLLEDEEVSAIIEILNEEDKQDLIKGYEDEIIKTNNKLWDVIGIASTIENKINKNGEIIDGHFKFQDSNVVVATLQILAKQTDKIREELDKLRGSEDEKTSDVVRIEWS